MSINTVHDLRNGFTLHKADPSVFVYHYTVYKNTNPFNRFTWEHHLAAINESSPCYWIYHGELRIGGLLMGPNLLTGLFLQPPYTDLYAVLGSLTAKVIELSDQSKPISSYGVAPWQVDSFCRHGFRLVEIRRNMLRPTEILPYEFPAGFTIVPLTTTSDERVATAQLMIKAFAGGAGKPMSAEDHVETCQYFYHTAIKKSEVLARASTLVYDQSSGELVAMCHMREWEGWPMVDDIAVRPDYQGRGLASALLRRAISEVASHYPVIRLFVTVGNSAESLYYKLGFLPGSSFYELEIPIQR